MTFSGDELVLILVSLVRSTRPSMLRQDGDGFTVDFEAIARSKTRGPADHLLLKIGALIESPPENQAENSNETPAASSRSLELEPREARQIAGALARVEALQAWPQDVVDLSRRLRARLSAAAGPDSA